MDPPARKRYAHRRTAHRRLASCGWDDLLAAHGPSSQTNAPSANLAMYNLREKPFPHWQRS